MPIFIERFILPVAAALIVMLLVTNPMNFDTTQRITGGLAIVFIAWFLSHTLFQRNELSKAKGEKPATSSIPNSPTALIETPARPQITDTRREPFKDGLIQRQPNTSAHHRSDQPRRSDKSERHIGNGNTIVGARVPDSMGDGNTFVAATDSNKNTIFNKGGTAIGANAHADSTGVAIGSGANAGMSSSRTEQSSAPAPPSTTVTAHRQPYVKHPH